MQRHVKILNARVSIINDALNCSDDSKNFSNNIIYAVNYCIFESFEMLIMMVI